MMQECTRDKLRLHSGRAETKKDFRKQEHAEKVRE